MLIIFRYPCSKLGKVGGVTTEAKATRGWGDLDWHLRISRAAIILLIKIFLFFL